MKDFWVVMFGTWAGSLCRQLVIFACDGEWWGAAFCLLVSILMAIVAYRLIDSIRSECLTSGRGISQANNES